MKIKKDSRILSIITMLILFFSFVSVINFIPVKAFSPSYCVTGNTQQYTAGILIGNTNINFGTLNLGICGIIGSLIVVTLFYPVANSTTGVVYSGVGLTDNLTDTYVSQQIGTMITCQSASNGKCPVSNPHPGVFHIQDYIFQINVFTATLKSSTNRINIHMTLNSATYNQNVGVSVSIVSGATPTELGGCGITWGIGTDNTQIFGAGAVFFGDGCTATIPSGDIAIESGMFSINSGSTVPHVGATYESATGNTLSYGSTYCPGSQASGFCGFYHAQYINTGGSPFSLSTGYQCTVCASGAGGNWLGQITLIFGSVAQQTTVVTTINTMQGGGLVNNATAKYLVSKDFNFYQSQNVATPSTVDNVTIKINGVHMTTATSSLYFALYIPANPNTLPTAGNPWTISTVYNINAIVTQTIFNNTANFFIHINPQWFIPASAYFAIGIMSNANASRTAGVTGTGIQVFLTASPLEPEMKYSIGSATHVLPVQFFSNTLKTPYDFIYFHLVYTVAVFTTTLGTATVTVNNTIYSGTSTVVSLVTSTNLIITTVVQSTTLVITSTILSLQGGQGSAVIISNITTYLPFFFFPLLFGAIMGVTGMLFGFFIALFLGYMLGLFPIWVFFIIALILYLLIRK